MNSDVAVLIVSYNVREALHRALASLPKDAHAVVVDNASRDGTQEHVRRHHPHVTLCALERNVGFSQAINHAAASCDAPYLLLLNPDAWLTDGALPALKQSLLAQHKRCGAWLVGPKQVDHKGRVQLSMGPTPTLLGEAIRRTAQRRLDRPDTLQGRTCRWLLNALWRKPSRVSWVAGSAMMIRREHFMRVGGFDPKFFLYFEDIDFCLRIRRAGGEVVYDPTVVVGHSRGASALGAQSVAQHAYRDSQAYFASRHQGPLMGKCVAAWAERRRKAAPPRVPF